MQLNLHNATHSKKIDSHSTMHVRKFTARYLPLCQKNWGSWTAPCSAIPLVASAEQRSESCRRVFPHWFLYAVHAPATMGQPKQVWSQEIGVVFFFHHHNSRHPWRKSPNDCSERKLAPAAKLKFLSLVHRHTSKGVASRARGKQFTR